MAQKYRIYKVFGRPIFAVPAKPRRLRLAGLARYQPFTPKRAAYRHLMRVAMLLEADHLLSTTVDTPIDTDQGFDFSQWMDRIRGELNDDNAAGMVFWPTQRARRRLYVHVFDGQLKPIAFVKISLDKHNDRCLEREAQTLRHLHHQGLKECRLPRVLRFAQDAKPTYLITEPIPEAARPIKRTTEAYPARCVAEYAGAPRRVPANEIPDLSWWSHYQQRIHHDCCAFDDELKGLLSNGIDVCRAHGDFGTNNIVREGDRLWIFDWEESHPDGPILTDEIGFLLGFDFARALADPLRFLRRFVDRHLRDAGPERRADVMMALAFRHAVGIGDAKGFFQHWDQVQWARR